MADAEVVIPSTLSGGAIAEIGRLLPIDTKLEINNIIGGNIFMIEL